MCVCVHVVYPIERMTAMMVELAKNPLKSMASIRKTLAVKYGIVDDRPMAHKDVWADDGTLTGASNTTKEERCAVAAL